MTSSIHKTFSFSIASVFEEEDKLQVTNIMSDCFFLFSLHETTDERAESMDEVKKAKMKNKNKNSRP